MMKTELNVLYEDNHIIVVVKPANILSQADSTNDVDIMSQIKAYLKAKYNKEGNVFLGLVHRLDRRVSGVMVFAKTSKAASRLSEQIRQHSMEKSYYAIVQGKLNDVNTLRHYLKKVNLNNKNIAVISSVFDKEAKEAILKYKFIKSVTFDDETITLLEVDLITGRYNQIRAQFAHLGYPLINDFKYGYRFNNYEDLLGLACVGLRFNHPITKERLSFNYIPSDGVWKKFN